MIMRPNIITKAKTKHIIPVELSRNKLNEVMNMALKAHKFNSDVEV